MWRVEPHRGRCGDDGKNQSMEDEHGEDAGVEDSGLKSNI